MREVMVGEGRRHMTIFDHLANFRGVSLGGH